MGDAACWLHETCPHCGGMPEVGDDGRCPRCGRVPPGTLVTVGHGTLDADDLAALLQTGGVRSVVDVRRFPGSRRHPHVAREEMQRWLPAAGIGYRWEPRLGGRRRTEGEDPHVAIRNASFRAYARWMQEPEWQQAMRQLLDEVGTTVVAVLCSETVWWRCHRRLIADAAVLLDGVPTLHLFHDGRTQPHPPMAAARVTPEGLRYDRRT